MDVVTSIKQLGHWTSVSRVIHPNVPWSDDLYVDPLVQNPHFDSTSTQAGAVTFVIFSYQGKKNYTSMSFKLNVQILATVFRFIMFNFEVLGQN